jgi:hypothetical protein
MAKTNDQPLTFGEIIDRIEQMREEMLMLQRSLEKMELAEPAISEARLGVRDKIRNRARLNLIRLPL